MTAIMKHIVTVVILTNALAGFGSALRVITDPQYFNAITNKELNVTCIDDAPDSSVQKIFSIEILRESQDKPIATINLKQKVTVDPRYTHKIKAKGQITTEVTKSYLTLIITKPDKEDAGVYTCSMFVMDDSYQIMEENAMGKFTFQEQGITDIVADLKEKVLILMTTVNEQGEVTLRQKEKMRDLEAKVTEQNKQMETQNQKIVELREENNKKQQQIETLKDLNSKHQTEMMDIIDQQNKSNIAHERQMQKLDEAVHNCQLKKASDLENLTRYLDTTIKDQGRQLTEQDAKASSRIDRLEDAGLDRSRLIQLIIDKNAFSSAFSVYGTNYKYNEEKLVFHHFLFNVGGHYDLRTGIYTAPKDGIYAFSLSAFSTSYNDIEVKLIAKDNIKSRLVAYSEGHGDQSSINTVVRLDKGDTVWINVENAKFANFKDKYTVFSGYYVR